MLILMNNSCHDIFSKMCKKQFIPEVTIRNIKTVGELQNQHTECNFRAPCMEPISSEICRPGVVIPT